MKAADSLQGRTAFITGGTSALGKGIARALLEKGANVVLGDLDETKLLTVKEELSAYAVSSKVETTVLNLLDDDSISKALDCTEALFGICDILVNNAGVCKVQDIMGLSDKDYDLTFGVNVKGLFKMCRNFASRLILKEKGGNIVNIASNAAKVTFNGQIDYSASKAAVANMTQSMAKEWADKGINVNAVCPGAVDTDMLKKCMLDAVEASDGSLTLEDCRKTWGPPQLGRLVQPYEVGRVIAFLASDAAVIIRGQAISVDGGNTPY